VSPLFDASKSSPVPAWWTLESQGACQTKGAELPDAAIWSDAIEGVDGETGTMACTFIERCRR